jgi:hypothetical protein
MQSVQSANWCNLAVAEKTNGGLGSNGLVELFGILIRMAKKSTSTPKA